MFIEDLKLDPNYVPPLEEQCRMIIGQWKALEYPSEDEIRLRDKKSLLAQDEFIRQLPKKIFDRTDLDFWQTLRQINWRVSPSPYRVLTNLCPKDNPLKIWTWNRTSVYNRLREIGCGQLAKNYKRYYEVGWDLFRTDFRDTPGFRSIVRFGNQILQECLDKVKDR